EFLQPATQELPKRLRVAGLGPVVTGAVGPCNVEALGSAVRDAWVDAGRHGMEPRPQRGRASADYMAISCIRHALCTHSSDNLRAKGSRTDYLPVPSDAA